MSNQGDTMTLDFFKVRFDKKQPVFTPFTVTIEINTLEEANALDQLFKHSHAISADTYKELLDSKREC